MSLLCKFFLSELVLLYRVVCKKLATKGVRLLLSEVTLHKLNYWRCHKTLKTSLNYVVNVSISRFINVSHGSVATHFRRGGVFIDYFI